MSSLFLRTVSVLATGWLLAVAPAQAEQSQTFGDYVVHYNAFDSSFLSADVARQYGITRSKYQGVINIAVQRQNTNAENLPVTARLSGLVKNDIAQSNELNFREIKDGAAIYYIATFNHGDKESLSFEIDVRPEDKGETRKLKFSQSFYAN